MTARKIYTFRLNDATPDDHIGRVGEITYRDGFLYYHDGATAGGEVIGGGSGGGSTSWSSVTGKPSFATVATSGSYADLTGKPTIVETNQTLNTSDSVSFNRLTVTGATGIEGGEIQLAKAPSSSLAGDVIIDVYENKLRFFEGGGTGRGFYLDLTTGANNTSTNIMSGGDSFSGAYADLTGAPTIPTSFSSLVNGSFTASLGTDGELSLPTNAYTEAVIKELNATALVLFAQSTGGNIKLLAGSTSAGSAKQWLFNGTSGDLTAPGNLQVDGGKIILNTAGNAYLESVDYGVNSANSAVNIFGGPYQKIKLRAGFGTEATWTFGTDGSLTLPAGGNISEGPSEGGGLTGAIKLTPTGGANEYQALLIYPTAGGDGDHIHLTAGGGSTELYLGNDLHFVKLESDGNIRIQADNGVNGAAWTFGTDGNLTFPAGGDILVDDGKIISADGEDFKIIVQDSDDNGNRLDLVVTDGTDQATRVEVDRDGVQIVTNLLDVENQRNWTFKSDGTTEFPNYTISQYSSLKIKSGASSSTAIWTFGTDGDLTAPRNIILNNPVTTVTTTVTGTVADSTGNPFTFRILKADNPQLVIPFADPNFVLKWTGSDAGSVAAGAQAPGGQGPSSLVSDDGTYWNFNSWFGLNTSRPNSGTEFTVEYGLVVSDTMISTTATNLVIEADAKQYRFGTDGNITLPAGGSIVDSAGANVFVSLATLKQVVADSTDFADFKSRIAGM